MTEIVPGTSPAGSLKGWSLKKLIAKNKDNIKALVMFLTGFSYFSGFTWPVFLAGIAAILGKMAVDTVDFFLSDVILE